MKIAITILSLFIMSSVFAASATDKPFKGTITGIVGIEKKATVTCAGMRCPPSRRYYTLTLSNVAIQGVGQAASVNFADVERNFNVTKEPTFFMYGGVRLKPGMQVALTGTIELLTFGRRHHILFSNPTKVEINKGYFRPF